MNNPNNILEDLNKNYFWDIHVSTLDLKKSKRLIIERVFSMGTLSDVRKLINYYGEKEIVEVLSRLNYLDPKTVNFVSKIFDIPLDKFQCQNRKQLVLQYWNS